MDSQKSNSLFYCTMYFHQITNQTTNQILSPKQCLASQKQLKDFNIKELILEIY
jgi:hypothetical protein